MGILAWGVIPPVLLLVYIYRLDKVEKEPVGLVLKVLLFGCLSVIPAVILEVIGDEMCSLLPGGLAYNLVYYFIVVAGAEEWSKRTAMKLAVWKNSEFNYMFDAVLYCVTAALGFALVENIEYMTMYGTGIALGRLIPVHTICGVFMGICLGGAKMHEMSGNVRAAKRANVLSLAVPMFIHGFYDFSVSSESDLLAITALLMVVALTVFAFRRVHYLSRNDKPLFAGSSVTPTVLTGMQAPQPNQQQNYGYGYGQHPAQATTLQHPYIQQGNYSAQPQYPHAQQQGQPVQHPIQFPQYYGQQGQQWQQPAYPANQGQYPTQPADQQGQYPTQQG